MCSSDCLQDKSSLLQHLNEIHEKLNDLNLTEIIEECIGEINELINKLNEDLINEINWKLFNLKLNDKDIEMQLKDIEKELNEYLNKRSEMISYRFQIQKGEGHYFDLMNIEKRIEIPLDQCLAFATNENSFLFIGKSFIYLYNQYLKFVQRKYFPQGKFVKEINWSKDLQRFILISSKELFILQHKTMIIKRYDLKCPLNEKWEHFSLTNIYLFISTFGINPSIIQFQLFPSILFRKIFKKEIHLNENHLINQMICKDNFIYLIVEDHSSNESFIRIFHSNSFVIIKEMLIGTGWNYNLCFFPDRYSILYNKFNSQIIYLNENDQFVKNENYLYEIINVISFYHRIIIQTKSYLNIHERE